MKETQEEPQEWSQQTEDVENKDPKYAFSKQSYVLNWHFFVLRLTENLGHLTLQELQRNIIFKIRF